MKYNEKESDRGGKRKEGDKEYYDCERIERSESE
jgi:hypothetical protein